MNYKKLENILLYVLLIIIGGVYLYTVAPTLSFWDCGEFIASAYTLAVPHPPGTPFYVFLGRIWLMIVGTLAAVLPISKEIAWHMNLLGLGFSVLNIFLLYKMVLKIFRIFQKRNSELNNIIVAFATCLGIAFFFTYWRNAIETEVYAAATLVFVLINYLAILWYESIKQGNVKNRYLLLAFYLIFLSTGVHLTPFLIFVPFYVFILIVERRYLKDTLFLLLGVFQFIFFALIFLVPEKMQTPILVLLCLILLTAFILSLNNPKKYKNWRFFWTGIFLIIIGISTELYLPLRAKKLTFLYKDKQVTERYLAGENIAPRINECNPGKDFTAFNNVLHRTQYGPPRLIPRQTQDATGFNLITGYFWQMAHFIRYLSWQPVPEGVNRFVRAIILFIFYICGFWGMVELYKREKKIFLFSVFIMFMLSFAMVGYLNLKFSPSDGNPQHQPREVRERDYFFHTAHVYFGIFIGLGFLGFLDLLKKETKNNRLANIGGLGGIAVFSVIPLFANIQVNNRFGDFIPKDYGYNMLVSCDNGSIVFTNGDNDTFPLWFAQEVLGFKRRVLVANLSLINTDWYIKQLKDWGAPVSFSDYIIDRLEPFMTRDRKIVYVKDIMVRNILASNAGVKLKNEDYLIPQKQFAARYLKNYKGKIPIYFASTVSRENFEGFMPYLRLEGLVYRVVGDSTDPQNNIDVEKTRNFFYDTYRYTGVFGPAKHELLSQIFVDYEKRKKEGEFYDYTIQKDDNTRRLYTNYAAGLFSLGYALRNEGFVQEAINAWKFAVLFEPHPIHPFLWNLGLLFANNNMIDSAEHYFAMIDVKDVNMMMQIGSIYRAIGNVDGAIEYFQKAININPRSPQAHFGLYSIYLEKHDTSSAVQILRNWLSVNPRDTSALNMLNELTKE